MFSAFRRDLRGCGTEHALFPAAGNLAVRPRPVFLRSTPLPRFPGGHDLTHPAVTIHGIGDARHVLAFGRPVTLLSAPGAATTAGCLWWRALIDAAAAEAPDTPCDDILDCGDSAGRAMAALRIGQKQIVLDPACSAFPAVASAAATIGASVLRARPAALDLADSDARRRLESWLSP